MLSGSSAFLLEGKFDDTGMIGSDGQPRTDRHAHYYSAVTLWMFIHVRSTLSKAAFTISRVQQSLTRRVPANAAEME